MVDGRGKDLPSASAESFVAGGPVGRSISTNHSAGSSSSHAVLEAIRNMKLMLILRKKLAGCRMR